MENRKLLKRIVIVVAVLLLAGYLALSSIAAEDLQWIILHDKEISGSVVDAETGEPIEGAIVVAMWELKDAIGAGFGGYAQLTVIETDKSGKFTIPSWIAFKPWKAFYVMDEGFDPKIVIYKPGYKLYQSLRSMRLGYPDDYSKTEEEKEKYREKYSIRPARLKRTLTNDEIWKEFSNFESQANFPDKYFTIREFKIIFNALENGVSELPEKNAESKQKLLEDIAKYRKYWLGDR